MRAGGGRADTNDEAFRNFANAPENYKRKKQPNLLTSAPPLTMLNKRNFF